MSIRCEHNLSMRGYLEDGSPLFVIPKRDFPMP